MKKYIFALFLPTIFLVSSCGNQTENSTDTIQPEISETRSVISKEAVAAYDVPLTGDVAKLNNWHFSVKLFETDKTFSYRVEMQSQELNQTETIVFPNLQQAPKPILQKGDSDLECMIGFLDQDSTFRKYILISSKNDQLSMKTVQHYSVTTSTTIK